MRQSEKKLIIFNDFFTFKNCHLDSSPSVPMSLFVRATSGIFTIERREMLVIIIAIIE
jgi:hypothetical protein